MTTPEGGAGRSGAAPPPPAGPLPPAGPPAPAGSAATSPSSGSAARGSAAARLGSGGVTAAHPAGPAVDLSPAARRVAVSVGGLAVLLAAIDAYVVVSIFVPILTRLGLAVNKLEQATPIVTGYLLGYVAGMPLLARVSDRYGRRIVIYAGLSGFILGSAFTALAAYQTQQHYLPGWWSPETWLVIGRALQGLAGGALLPVTLALAADLFSEASRPRVLGGVGAAQELGSVLGPLYGAWIVGQFSDGAWPWIFWVNIPLAVLALALVHKAVPRRNPGDEADRPRVDIVGGLLLAGALGVSVAALDNQHPDVSVLPPNGRLLLEIAGGLFVLFLAWEIFARTKLMDFSGVAKRPFFAAVLTSLLAGAGLLVTLLFVQLDGQTVLQQSAADAALLLARFLIALPIGAVIGGFLVRWFGERWLSVAGMLIAAAGFWLVSRWPVAVLAAKHHLGPITLPMLDTDLAITGLGLGLTIAPLASAVLRAVPSPSHGIGSAALVVARMMGMLIGVSALAAWGLNRFHQLTATLYQPIDISSPNYPAEEAAYEKKLFAALQQEYTSIFRVTILICLAGAIVALFLHGKRRAAAGAEGNALSAA